MRVAVTGANGFIGKALVKSLALRGYQTLAYSRKHIESVKNINIIQMNSPDLSVYSDWEFRKEQEIDTLIHTAARVHITNKNKVSDYDVYLQVNVLATLNLAAQAAQAGIKRFISAVSGLTTQPGWCRLPAWKPPPTPSQPVRTPTCTSSSSTPVTVVARRAIGLC